VKKLKLNKKETTRIMLDSFDPSTKIFIFRLCAAVFVSAIQFFASLLGKLIKEQSIGSYSLYNSFCLGVILAQGIGISSSGRLRVDVNNFAVSDITYMIAFLSLIFVHTSTTINAKSYEKISTKGSLEQEFDEDIELSELNEIQFGEDRMNLSSSQQELYPIWRNLAFLAFSFKQFSDGITLGNEEHDSLRLFRTTAINAALSAMVFGIICEESIATSTVFLYNLLILSLALPIGILTGSVVVVNISRWLFIHELVNAVCSGMITAIAVCFIFQLERIINEQYESSLSTNSLQRKIFRGCFIAAGFAIVTLQSLY
jgi:hypothetical protein